MGAWGIGNFENDEALDWLDTLTEARDLGPAGPALQAALEDADGYLEAPTCCEALAAAEAVAAARGRPLAPLPEALKMWLPGRAAPSAEMLEAARRAVARIRETSELRDLWEESETLDAWIAVLDDLAGRLA